MSDNSHLLPSDYEKSHRSREFCSRATSVLKKTDLPIDNPNDTHFAVILSPDPWELDPEKVFTDESIWKKVNPHIGITVQPDYYRNEIAKARLDPEKRKETITKLFNIFQSDRVAQWITPDQVRALQSPASRIDTQSDEDGWITFVGFDFSLGNDLHAQSYLSYNPYIQAAAADHRPQATVPGSFASGQSVHVPPMFRADLDAWITAATLEQSSIRALYEQWIADGWLHVSEGETLAPELPINRIVELSEHVKFIAFGYDPYKATAPINLLKTWIYSTYDIDPKDVVKPVRQNFATYNPAVLEIDYMVKNNPPLIEFSDSPLWPWQFGNCVLMESNDGMENHKPVKANPGSDACKVDNVQCLLSALILYDQIEGTEEK